MSLKHLLGLDDSSLHEEDLYRLITDAQRADRETLEIPSSHGPIVLRYKKIEMEGLSRGLWQ